MRALRHRLRRRHPPARVAADDVPPHGRPQLDRDRDRARGLQRRPGPRRRPPDGVEPDARALAAVPLQYPDPERDRPRREPVQPLPPRGRALLALPRPTRTSSTATCRPTARGCAGWEAADGRRDRRVPRRRRRGGLHGLGHRRVGRFGGDRRDRVRARGRAAGALPGAAGDVGGPGGVARQAHRRGGRGADGADRLHQRVLRSRRRGRGARGGHGGPAGEGRAVPAPGRARCPTLGSWPPTRHRSRSPSWRPGRGARSG